MVKDISSLGSRHGGSDENHEDSRISVTLSIVCKDESCRFQLRGSERSLNIDIIFVS